ncbi:MAG: DUF3604 domain-containing protein [Phycisphaerae bacterium]|nr:DUF3604 domain-containing protein [Phycisphaerae bacterium]
MMTSKHTGPSTATHRRPRSTLLVLPALTVCVAALASAAPAETPAPNVPKFVRPVRIPEQIPLQTAEPPYALAGQKSTWRLTFKLARDIKPNQTLRLELWGGRNNKGSFRPVQIAKPNADGSLSVQTADGKPISLSKVDAKGNKAGATFALAIPSNGFKEGTVIHVTLGDTSKGGKGTTADSCRMLNKFFVLYCPELVEGGAPRWGLAAQKEIVGACLMHILGNKIDHIRAYVPSQCSPGQDVEILVRPEDKHSNLSVEPLEQVDVLLDEKKLDATVKRVKNSTCAEARVKLPDEGVHRLRVVDRRTGKSCLTNPTECRATQPRYNRYWGMIHGHTELSDGWGTIDEYFRQMRDECLLDFAASSDHDHGYETPPAYWKITCEAVKKWNEPRRFVAILGYEWAKWRRNGDGDRNVYYLQDDQPQFSSDEGKYPRPPDLFKALAGKKAIIIPHHPGSDGNHCDYKDHDPVHERFIEIHQIRGCYECSAEDGNPLPAKPDHPGGKLVAEGFVQRALALGWRVGFTAGGDDHRGTAGTDKPSRIENGKVITAGSMCVLAKDRTRESIWDGLWNRRVIATSGPRMLLDVDINGQTVGGELSVSKDSDLAKSRRIKVDFHGAAPVERIDVIRNNKVIFTTKDNVFIWHDTTKLKDAMLPPAKFCNHPFCFYYVRVVQTDGQAAWASPIWLDP